MIPATQTNNLKTKIWNELKIMLPYNELTFTVACKEELQSITLQMRDEELKIMKGKALFPKNKLNEVKLCLIDIYKEFEEEIQELFNWRA